MNSQVIGAIIGGAAAIIAASIAAWQSMRVKRVELELKKATDDVKKIADVPGEVPAVYAAEAAHIRQLRIFRQNFVARFSFRERAAGEMELEVEISFSVVNCLAEDYAFEHQVEVVPDQVEDVTRILRVAATGTDLSKQYDDSFPADQPPRRKFAEKVSVRPNSKGPKNQFESRFKRIIREHDAEVIFFVQPTLGAEVRVDAKPDDLDVSVVFSHRESDLMTVLPSASSPRRWRLEKAFLPWQSLYVQWHKKSPARREAGKGDSTAG